MLGLRCGVKMPFMVLDGGAINSIQEWSVTLVYSGNSQVFWPQNKAKEKYVKLKEAEKVMNIRHICLHRTTICV